LEALFRCGIRGGLYLQPAEMDGNQAPRRHGEKKSVIIVFRNRKKRLTEERRDRKMLFAPVICLPLDVCPSRFSQSVCRITT
jgi:hypothetical protein